MLELKGVCKTYGPLTALHPTDLTLPRGRTTVLLGPSGCGKSTLLRVMVGLVAPDRGSVALDGVLVSAANARQLRQRMGYVVQDGGLFPHLTARGNVLLMARHLGREAAANEARLAELAALTQFPTDGLDRFPAQLSGGQRQRVSLMRALMLDPDLLLFDEPLGALDPMIRSDLQADLRRIFRSLNKTVVLVTHDLGEAAYLGDHLVLMKAGSIVQQGPLSDLIERPADPFVTRFVNAQRTPLASLQDTASLAQGVTP